MAEHIFHNLSALRPGDNNPNAGDTAAKGDDLVDTDMATHSGDDDVMAAQSDDDSDTMSTQSDDSDAMDTQSIGGYDTVATQYDDLDDDVSGTDSDSEDEDMIDDVLPPQFYPVHPNDQAAGGQSPPFGGHWFEVDSDDETDGQSMAVNSGTNNTAAAAPASPVQTREVVLFRAVPRGFVTISDPSVASASVDEDQDTNTGGNIAARRRIGEGVAMELVISVSGPLAVTTVDSVLFSSSSSTEGDSDSLFVSDQGTTADDNANTTTDAAAVHDKSEEKQQQQQQQQHQGGMMAGTVDRLVQDIDNFNAIIMTLTPAQLLSGPQELRDSLQQLLARIEDLRFLLNRSNIAFPAAVETGCTNEQHDHHGEEDETVNDN